MLVETLGGTFSPHLSLSVTHLIAGEIRDSKKYIVSFLNKSKGLTSSIVEDGPEKRHSCSRTCIPRALHGNLQETILSHAQPCHARGIVFYQNIHRM